MYCSNCGSTVTEGSKFCVKCGHPVEIDVVARQPAIPSTSSPLPTSHSPPPTEVKATSTSQRLSAATQAPPSRAKKTSISDLAWVVIAGAGFLVVAVLFVLIIGATRNGVDYLFGHGHFWLGLLGTAFLIWLVVVVGNKLFVFVFAAIMAQAAIAQTPSAFESPANSTGQTAKAMPAIFGAFGDSIESVKQTNFFTWFSLEQVGPNRDAQGRDVTEFRPEAPKFRRFVSFKLICDSGGHLVAVELTLAREFINSGSDGVFAADIAKSFILTATPKADLPKVQSLAGEIGFGSFRASQRPVLLHADRAKTSLPAQPSQGYATYLGQLEHRELALSDLRLHATNENMNGVRSLIISFTK